jgi:hypothetical protein
MDQSDRMDRRTILDELSLGVAYIGSVPLTVKVCILRPTKRYRLVGVAAHPTGSRL